MNETRRNPWTEKAIQKRISLLRKRERELQRLERLMLLERELQSKVNDLTSKVVNLRDW